MAGSFALSRHIGKPLIFQQLDDHTRRQPFACR
jgi:hypothetical protein